MTVIGRNGAFDIEKRQTGKGYRQHGDHEVVVNDYRYNASHDQQEDGSRTRNGELLSFAGGIESILDVEDLVCKPSGFLLALGNEHLISQRLLRRDKAHEVIGNAFGGKPEQNDGRCT